MTIPSEALKCKKCKDADVDSSKVECVRRGWCYQCTYNYHLEYRKAHMEKFAANAREYRKRNQEVYRERMRIRGRELYWENPQHHRSKAISQRKKLRDSVFSAYGGYVCNCCGETIPEFLTLDHINNDGAEHRKMIGTGGNNLLQWLKKHSFPEGFQVLCWNCQWGKNLSGECPHKRERVTTIP